MRPNQSACLGLFCAFAALALSACRVGGNSVSSGTSSSPLTASDASLLYVQKSGDTMTGPLSVPMVGLGTTSPQSILDIVDTSASPTGPYGVTIERDSTINNSSPRIGFLDLSLGTSATAPVWYVDNSADTFRIFRQPNSSTAGTSFMTVQNTGAIYSSNQITATSGSQAGMTLSQTATPTSVSTADVWALSVASNYTANFNSNRNIGINAEAANSGTATLSNAIGSVGDVQNVSTGIITTATGIEGYVKNESTGAISTAYAGTFAVSNPGGGVITYGYGVNIGTIAGTNHYSLYASDATSPSYFAGEVGIGTTSPVATLDVRGTSTTTTSDDWGAWLQSTVAPTANSTYSYYGAVNRVLTASTYNIQNLVGSANQAFANPGATGTITDVVGAYGQAGNFSAANITNAYGVEGNVGNSSNGVISTAAGLYASAPTNTGTGSITNYYGLYIATPTVATNNYGAYIGGNVGIGTATPSAPLTVSTPNTTGNIATFVSTGAGGAGCSIAWNGTSCSSDIRLKDDVRELEASLEKLLGVNGVSFVWKKDPSRSPQIGFIAQDLEKTYPELVRTDAQGYKQVNYANFTAVLTEAVKDLYHRWSSDSGDIRRELAAVKAENAELKARLEKLERAFHSHTGDKP